MKYKELLDLYKQGLLEEAQQKQVEAEIEKHDAISEYLCEEEKLPSLEAFSLPDQEEQPEENSLLTREIQKTIHRTFLKLGLTIGAVVLAVTLFVLLALPKAVDLFYYRPDQLVSGSGQGTGQLTNQMSLDFSVWTELFLPGRYRSSVAAEPRGYGAYDISILQTASPDGRFYAVNGQLVRNHLRLYDTSYFRLPASNAFLLPEGKKNGFRSVYVDGDTGKEIPVSRAEERQAGFQYLRDKPTNDLLIAYISFNEIMDFKDFAAWYQGLNIGYFDAWAGIYTEDQEGRWATENTGLSLTPSGSCMDWDRAQYPLLSLLGAEEEKAVDVENEALFKEHFLTMLRYMEDHPALFDLFGFAPLRLNTEAAQTYVEEKGLQVYGLALVASRDELLKLEGDSLVSQISTTPY